MTKSTHSQPVCDVCGAPATNLDVDSGLVWCDECHKDAEEHRPTGCASLVSLTAVFLLLGAVLSSCVTTFRHGHLESVPYSGHGPIFHVPAGSPYQVSPRAIDAGPEVAPILSTLLQHAAASLDTLTAPSQPILIPVLYQGHEDYQQIEPWDVYGHTVPLGLVSDGASVPRIFWPFMSPDGLHRAAAWWHDWLYINRGLLPDGFRYTRLEADTAFKNVMLASGVSPWRATIAYDGVRLGGWAVWNRQPQPPVILPVAPRQMGITLKPRTFFAHIFAP